MTSVYSSDTGVTLDSKGPLLKSMEALNKSSINFLKFFPKRYPKFIVELDHELWELFNSAKTKHNEVAQTQHEFSLVFETINFHIGLQLDGDGSYAVSYKQNRTFGCATTSALQLILCITSSNQRPTSEENSLFILSIQSQLHSVDLLELFEAPPSILFVFLGAEVTDKLLESLNGVAHKDNNRLSIDSFQALLDLEFDDSERYRTSPTAFIRNKFEFLIAGWMHSIVSQNTFLNIVISESFDIKEWHQEAKSRGIPNITNTIDELKAIIANKNVQLFENLNVMTKTKCQSKYEVKLGSYAKTISIESAILIHMVKREVIPAVNSILGKFVQCITLIETVGLKDAQLRDELEKLSNLSIEVIEKLEALEGAIQSRNASNKTKQTAIYERYVIMTAIITLKQIYYTL
ncbi:MAG: putative glutamine synthetase [Streblomastix strix]|uniref:Putative glutamine synthetase n=1 Tax=Streblomastix strix TaxID=222440 RepID=A0A5J4V191_9EUKA|nr:MAG: putative glutamine synthetase [Streblomastix strix]